jgi:hypothetical protein
MIQFFRFTNWGGQKFDKFEISSMLSKRRHMKKINHLMDLDYIVPVITLGLILISYAIFLPSLRFYLDDWPQLYSYLVRGLEGLKQYFIFDGRPFGYWPDLIFFHLWGTNPVLWHLTNYFLRWLISLFLWWTFIKVWSHNKREVAWIVCIFAVFPLFKQQSMGLTFIAHWVCYLLFSISLFLMVWGIQRKKNLWLILLFSLIIDIPNLFTYEYFIGVEFLRPLIIWYLLSGEKTPSSRMKRTILYWAPFALLAGGYIYWRLFLMENLRSGTSFIILANIINDPVSTIQQLVQLFLKDTIYMILDVWFPAMDVQNIDFTVRSKIFALALSLAITTLFLAAILIKNRKEKFETTNEKSRFSNEALIIGFMGIILGCVPGWMIGQSVSNTFGLWNDRFGLAAMFGASIFLVGFLSWVSSRLKREVIIVILIGLAVGRNFSITNDYRWSSIYQSRFFWQLKWRAPGIASPTSILADHEMFTDMGVYPTSFALNLLYPNQQPMPYLDYWFYTLYKYFPNISEDLIKNQTVYQGHWYAKFEAQSQNSIVIDWQKKMGGCVWVLSNNDRYNPLISENTKAALAVSNLDRISLTDQITPSIKNLFGEENKNNWCYYFETADLDRQLNNWHDIPLLYEEAEQMGFSPQVGTELMPFIEGYAHTGNPGKAMELTYKAYSITNGLRDYLCDNWIRISKELKVDNSIQSVFQQINQKYACLK